MQVSLAHLHQLSAQVRDEADEAFELLAKLSAEAARTNEPGAGYSP